MLLPNNLKLIECPRDAMQGRALFIPTDIKIAYLNLLLKVGFHTLDFGSFVSPKAIPQMADTSKVLAGLDLSDTETKLLAIVANTRGAIDACTHKEIDFLGFPLSISETFQQRNTKSSIAESLITVEEILSLCDKNNKQAVIYLSMGFGNPYGDEWNYEIVEKYAEMLTDRGAKIISLADTIGSSTPDRIEEILPKLIQKFDRTEIGIHLHSTAEASYEKIAAIYESSCMRIDSALKGYGGCPMAEDHLTGNLATENVINFFTHKGVDLNLDLDCWQQAMDFSNQVFD